MDEVETYVANTCAMWASLAPGAGSDADSLTVRWGPTTRVILRRPVPPAVIAERVAELPAAGRSLVEDPFGAESPALPDGAVRVLRMPVMGRAADLPAPPATGAPVRRVEDAAQLAEAERVIVDGFPLPAHQPWAAGQTLPPRVLELPGWRVWLAYRDGRAAAAAYTYDDGVAAGVYFLATLPAYRSLGLGRAIMSECVWAHPDRTITLVATEAGLPLYTSLGFTTVGTATWYARSA